MIKIDYDQLKAALVVVRESEEILLRLRRVSINSDSPAYELIGAELEGYLRRTRWQLYIRLPLKFLVKLLAGLSAALIVWLV